jgi:hypothetical protein
VMLKGSVKGAGQLGGRVLRASRLAGFDEAAKATAGIIADEAENALRAAAPRAPEDSERSVILSPSLGGRGWRVLAPEPLGRILEFGTLRLAPRPWLEPAFRAALKPATDRLGAWLAKFWR